MARKRNTRMKIFSKKTSDSSQEEFTQYLIKDAGSNLELNQGYSYVRREKTALNLKNSIFVKQFSKLPKKEQFDIVALMPEIILSLDNPSEPLICHAVMLEISLINDLDKKLISDEVVKTAITSNLRTHSDFVDYSLTRYFSNKKTSEDAQMYFLVNLVSVLDASDIYKISHNLSETALSYAISKKKIELKHLKKPSKNIIKLTIKKDYNNLKDLYENKNLFKNITEDDIVDISIETIKQNKKSINFIDLLKNRSDIHNMSPEEIGSVLRRHLAIMKEL